MAGYLLDRPHIPQTFVLQERSFRKELCTYLRGPMMVIFAAQHLLTFSPFSYHTLPVPFPYFFILFYFAKQIHACKTLSSAIHSGKPKE